MPDLYHSLLGNDLGYLGIVAGLWAHELDSTTIDAAAKELTKTLLDAELVNETIASLAPQARMALIKLARARGRLPWASFVREFGDIREMGAGKRDRERPHLKPSSTTEILFYHALLARAFFDTAKGPQEFAYIPDDLISLIGPEANPVTRGVIGTPGITKEPLGRAASTAERSYTFPVEDRLLDDTTSLLAAMRTGSSISVDPLVAAFLSTSGLVKKNVPQAEKIKLFLEAPRREALRSLVAAWHSSTSFNELRLVPGLICEGEWTNQPRVTREFILDLLEALPKGIWWNLSAFIRELKKKYPDYQRPAGDYDSWFIRRASDGFYLRGFDSWDPVDGELIRFFITNILYRLNRVELAAPAQGAAVTAFRTLDIEKLAFKVEDAKIHLGSQGALTVPRYVSRAVRYQLSRFCDWENERGGEYRYLITPQSLSRAKKQGLKVEHLLALLSKHAEAGIPPILVKALKRWEVNGTEARAETQVVLRVSRPEVLNELRKSKAARFLGEPLGPTAVIIKSGAQTKVLAALGELGFLAENTLKMDDH